MGLSHANTVGVPLPAWPAGGRIATAVAEARSTGGAVAPAAGGASEPAPAASTADAPSAAFQDPVTSRLLAATPPINTVPQPLRDCIDTRPHQRPCPPGATGADIPLLGDDRGCGTG